MSPKDDITLKTILEHMRAMEDRLISRIEGAEDRLGSRIEKVETGLKNLNFKVDQNHVQVMTQLDNIDARLDDLEVVQVPKLKKAVGMSGN